ncbi:MAG: low molecular weight phosphatase family protein [Oscillospiraceae bacterium]|jgi:protein-tyrosine-phosphatase|nr:low molecular weight phosphatase family protein [Oscillospiraceae bacterium]
MNVLFVCTGNTCRSPMAAGLFGVLHPEISCASAGILATDGLSASAHAVAALQTFGVDISDHRSRFLTPDIAQTADLIVAIGAYHQQVLQGAYPHKRVVLLGNGIDDPYGHNLEAYKECAFQIQDALALLGEM